MAFNEFTPRDARGRFISKAAAASMLEEVGVFAKDLEGWVAGSEALRWALHAKAEEVKAYWQEIAPVWGDKDPKKLAPNPFPEEAYRDSIEVVEKDGTFSVGTALPGLSVWLEYGSEHNPEHGYGARVLEHFGGGPVDSAEKISDRLFVG